MEVTKPTLLERVLAKILSPLNPKERPLSPTTTEWTELYASYMFEEGNLFHSQIIRRFLPYVHLDETNLETIQHQATQGILIYVTYNLGQLEYNVFNNLFLEKGLPLATFNNALRTRRWFSFKNFIKSYRQRISFLSQQKKIPDPVDNHYLKTLLLENKSFLFSLNEWDPEYLSTSCQGLLHPLLEIQKGLERPIFICPTQLIWDKRPKRQGPSIFEALFGENERPGKWRKIILFLRHYKKRAVVKLAKPIPLKGSVLSLYREILQAFQIERKTLTGPPIHSRQWFIEKILNEEDLSRTVYEVSKEKKKPIESVKHLSLKYAKEITADLRYTYIEFAAAVLDYLFKNLFEGIQIDLDGIKTIKKTLGKGPVVLVPNHRSHLDYLLLGYLCYQHNIVSPYVAAGLNLAFWPLGFFFRRCGAFFLRRSFEGNKLYKKVFQIYLKTLIQEGYLQEFFIEGGRSRTGKLRPPKLGMLSTYADCLNQGVAKDIYFIPVSITYDKVLEGKSYIEEVKGRPKAKEKILDLLKLTRFLKGKSGKIYVNFEEEISLQEVAHEIPETEWEKKKAEFVPMLADRICHAINREVVVTPKSLAASALLLKPARGITKEEFEKTSLELLKYLQWKQVKLSDTLLKNPEWALQEALNLLEHDGLLKRHQGFEQGFFEIPSEKRFELDLSKNVSIHYFVSLSLLSNLLLANLFQKQNSDQLVKEYAQFQRLFQFEFRFSTRKTLPEHLDKLCCYLQEQKVISYTNAQVAILPEGLPSLKNLCSLIQNFLEAYWVAWDTFLLQPTQAFNEKELIKAIMQHAKDQWILGRLKYPEAISQNTFENAIQSFKALGLFSLDSIEAKRLKESLAGLLFSKENY